MKLPFLKKREFRPDREGTNQFQKLIPTPQQQLRILCWALYGLICLIGLIAQDVALYRINIFGGCTDILPCMVLMIVVMQGVENGSVFVLIASVLYFFSGSSAGFYVVPLLTAVAVLVVIFRQAFMRRGFWTVLICALLGMLLYEMGLFIINLFLGLTVFSRIGAVLCTVVLSMVTVPVCYPLFMAIGKLGGQPWGE